MKVLVPGRLPARETCPTTSIFAAEGAEFAVPTSSEMAEQLGDLPDLRVVQVLSAGIDWVEPHVPDRRHALQRRRRALARRGAVGGRARSSHDLGGFARGATPRSAWQPRELDGKRVVIVGYGSIGRAVERRLAPFGVRIGRVARSAREGSSRSSGWREAVEGADVVVVLAPLSEDTRGLVGADVLARMPDGALLVNAGRGPVVDTDALVEARPGRADPRRARRHRPRAAAGRPPAVDARRRLPHPARRGRHAGGRARRAGARARTDAAPPRGPAAASTSSGRVQRARDALAVAPQRARSRRRRARAARRARSAGRAARPGRGGRRPAPGP